MPRSTVTDRLRRNPVRSPRRIAHTANWQVNELRIRRIVAGSTNGRNCEEVRLVRLGVESAAIAPPGAFARVAK